MIFLDEIEVLNFWQIGNKYIDTVITVFLSQGCNEPLTFHYKSQWSLENPHLSIRITHGTREH